MIFYLGKNLQQTSYSEDQGFLTMIWIQRPGCYSMLNVSFTRRPHVLWSLCKECDEAHLSDLCRFIKLCHSNNTGAIWTTQIVENAQPYNMIMNSEVNNVAFISVQRAIPLENTQDTKIWCFQSLWK